MHTMCQDVPGCARMCQDVPGVKSIKSVASLSRTFAASSIGSMKPKPFFSLNLRTWHLVWPQECQMQDEQQNSSKNTHATISAHHPKSKTLGVGQVGRCFQTLAVTPAWHCAIFKTISGFNTGCQAISLGHAREVLHPPPAKRSSEAGRELSRLSGPVRSVRSSACLLLAIRRRLSIHWHSVYSDIMASLWHHCGRGDGCWWDMLSKVNNQLPSGTVDCNRVPGWQFSRFIQDYTNLSGRPWWQTR